MFSVRELETATARPAFRDDWKEVVRGQAGFRLAQPLLLSSTIARRLQRFVSSVLVSAPRWSEDGGHHLAAQAAQVAEALSRCSMLELDTRRLRLRAALLYELADQPAMASAVLQDQDGPIALVDLFKRRGPFKSLGAELSPINFAASDQAEPLRLALCQEARELASLLQGTGQPELLLDAAPLAEVASQFRLDLDLTELRAFEAVVKRRASRSTRLNIPVSLVDGARDAAMPPELWAHQAQLLNEGLLSSETSWGVAAPTGTGKTFMARLMVLAALDDNPGKKVLFLVPSNALVHQVSTELHRVFGGQGVTVSAVTPQLVALDDAEDEQVAEADVLVLTPEKADLLLRIGADFLSDVVLVIVDEAHHIENATRGVLLELYLARLKTSFAGQARYVLLSAVTPNIDELVHWISPNARARLFRERATRMRIGIFRIRKTNRRNEGWIDYVDGAQIRPFDGRVETTKSGGLVQLAAAVGIAGPVLVIAQGQGTAESLAAKLDKRLSERPGHEPLSAEALASDTMQRLDARLEREMYPDVQLRQLIRNGVAYHHAGLPPRVREALEAAITANHIRYVIATTTLGEGVNFPFASVIVQALSIREAPEAGKPASWRIVTPRVFWNIAGRAGRPGYDHEGQVILYEPSLALDKVKAVIDPYVNPDIRDIEPVRSALAEGLLAIRRGLADGAVLPTQLMATELPDDLPRHVHGVVNLLRVGIAHARASWPSGSSAQLFETTLAAQTLPDSDHRFAQEFFADQTRVLDTFLAADGAPPVRLVAELGLSLDTLSRLQSYVALLDDWQVESMSKLLFGGRLNFDTLRFVLGPVLARMAELEGGRLGGFYTETVIDWCMGKPFASIPLLQQQKRLEDLIRVVYSKIGYMLPWGLYAFDRFLKEAAKARRLTYDGEVQSVAYLVDAGVPDMAALTLVGRGFERSDASRLSRAYYSSSEARETTDIVRWVRAQTIERLSVIVRGVDRRRLDHDFRRLVTDLRREAA